jgi:hypothetical protein
MNIKLKGLHFDTVEVIKAESQEVQNMHLKWQKRWERCIGAEGDYFDGDGCQ